MRVKVGQFRQVIKEKIKRLAEVTGRKLQKAVGKITATEKPVYDLLSFAFTSTIEPDDVRYIRCQPLKNAVRMVDYDDMLGNMDAGASDLSRYGFTPRQLGDLLFAHGTRPTKQQKRPRPMPRMYD